MSLTVEKYRAQIYTEASADFRCSTSPVGYNGARKIINTFYIYIYIKKVKETLLVQAQHTLFYLLKMNERLVQRIH